MNAKPLIAMLIANGAVSSANAKNTKGTEMTQQEKDVLAAVQTMTSSLENGDIDTVMTSYEDGAVIVFEPGAPVSDKDASRVIFEQMAAANPDVTYSGHEVIIAGDTAVHIAPWSMNGKTPDGTPLQLGGLSVAVLRRQEDGGWKMVIDNPYGGRLLNN